MLEFPVTVCAACSINCVTASGWEIIEGCAALTSTICACARWAMKSCRYGGMTRSIVSSKYQLGIDFQAGTPDMAGSMLITAVRWVDGEMVALPVGRLFAKHGGKTPCLMYTL